MFLFLINEADLQLAALPKFDKAYALESLFEVSMGLIPDRYHPRTRSNDTRVSFLKIGSFKLNDPEKDQWSLSDYESRNIVDFEKLESETEDAPLLDEPDSKKSFLPEKKILIGDDYLFSIRGVPKGYSMARSFAKQKDMGYSLAKSFAKQKDIRLVASNHFIQVRPLPGADLHIPFIHLVFDLIVEQVLSKKYMVKKSAIAKKGSTSAVFNTMKVDEIRDLKISIPSGKEAQEAAYLSFIENYEQYMQASLKYYKLRNGIMERMGFINR